MMEHVSVDWAATGAMLQGIGTVSGAATVLVAALIGSNTFNTWRQQKISERRIEQAERILTATYKVRRDFSLVRSPAMWSHEMEAGEARLKELGTWDKIVGDNNDFQRFRVTQAYYNRLASTRDDQLALEECQPMARALFGEQLEKALENLSHQFRIIRVYVDANHDNKRGMNAELRRKIESTIWEGYPSSAENEMDGTIAAQVKIIEDTCVPVLQLEGGTPVGWRRRPG